MTGTFFVYFICTFFIMVQQVASINQNKEIAEVVVESTTNQMAANDGNDNGKISDILQKVLEKQSGLEAIFQLILESSEKNSTAEFIKQQFDELKNVIKSGKNAEEVTNHELLLVNDQELNSLAKRAKTFNSCRYALDSNDYKKDVYLIQIENSNLASFYVYCDVYDGLDWMIIQRRKDGSIDFYKNWNEYKNGFGGAFGEYWIGLDRLHEITHKEPHELLIVMDDYSGHRLYAKYSNFLIGNMEQGYQLTLGAHAGNATDALSYHEGMKFSTHDRDNDKSELNCAKTYEGGWWYNDCFKSNLNGQYFYKTAESSTPNGINWGNIYEKKYVHMAIRPTSVFS